jgi:hypothetical protein
MLTSTCWTPRIFSNALPIESEQDAQFMSFMNTSMRRNSARAVDRAISSNRSFMVLPE